MGLAKQFQHSAHCGALCTRSVGQPLPHDRPSCSPSCSLLPCCPTVSGNPYPPHPTVYSPAPTISTPMGMATGFAQLLGVSHRNVGLPGPGPERCRRAKTQTPERPAELIYVSPTLYVDCI